MIDLFPRNAEILVGIVARIGVDTKAIVQAIVDELKEYRYDTIEIHITDSIKGLLNLPPIIQEPIEARYTSYISACNDLRSKSSDDIMAKLAIEAIKSRRSGTNKSDSIQERRAYVINQIKRPEEFDLFRKVYGEHYVQISCHADEQARVEKLKQRISTDHFENPKNLDWDTGARKLVNTDESQEDVRNGQRVRQVFPLSDVIINANSNKKAEEGIERFFKVLFGDKSVTPTKEEYGMELANTASQRSSDMSRQVGAAIFNKYMEVQALGCNESAKAGGGTYWEGDKDDGREFTLGRDFNGERRQAVLLDLVQRLKQAGGLSPELEDAKQIREFLFQRNDKIIADAQLMDSLEYGRSVHAEMNAITDAARGGHPIRECQLFTNTFPCHNCAKHIVAAGLSEVIYNHPYPKSYAQELFADSIVINPPAEQALPQGRVTFRQFIGILGPMYARVFTKARWKIENGVVPRFIKRDAFFIRTTPIPAYEDIENYLLADLLSQLRKAGALPETFPENDLNEELNQETRQ